MTTFKLRSKSMVAPQGVCFMEENKGNEGDNVHVRWMRLCSPTYDNGAGPAIWSQATMFLNRYLWMIKWTWLHIRLTVISHRLMNGNQWIKALVSNITMINWCITPITVTMTDERTLFLQLNVFDTVFIYKYIMMENRYNSQRYTYFYILFMWIALSLQLHTVHPRIIYFTILFIKLCEIAFIKLQYRNILNYYIQTKKIKSST